MNTVRHLPKQYVFRVAIMALVLLILTVLFAVTLSCSSTQEGKALFEAKCVKCHPLDYALREKKSLPEWKKTTEKMSRYSGGAITEKEAIKIAKYLASI